MCIGRLGAVFAKRQKMFHWAFAKTKIVRRECVDSEIKIDWQMTFMEATFILLKHFYISSIVKDISVILGTWSIF